MSTNEFCTKFTADYRRGQRVGHEQAQRELELADHHDAEDDDATRAPSLRMRRPNDYAQTREVSTWPTTELG